MLLRIPVLLLIALGYLTTIESVRRNRYFNIEIRRFYTVNFTAPLKSLDCDFRKLGENRYALDVNFLLERVLRENAEFRILIRANPGKSTKILTFVDVRVNSCETLSKQTMPVSLANLIMNEIMRTSNIPFTCPIQANVLYNLSNFKLTEDFFPVYTLIMKFNFTMSFYENKKEYARILLEGATKPKKS